MSLQTGQIIDGKYRIVRELGAGAMGAVYEGENLRIKRRVAIKVLLPAVAERGDVVQRFEREAQAAGRIGSDHIVEVLDLGSLEDGGFYMVMEFLEGETLGERIRRAGRLDPREAAPLAQQLLMGLEMAHDARIIHRDLKPENVFLVREHAGQRDFVKILDFGVSKFNPLNDDDAMSMTRTGTVVGTPFYMAPEQAKGARDIDHRSDLYSVGVILYEAVTGQRPFVAGTFNELIFKIVLETPPPPEKFAPDLDHGFGRIIRKAMAREPEERFATAAEFRDALYIWLHTGKDSAKATELRAPPVGADVDWDAEKKTLLIDGDDPSNERTQLRNQGGGGTALMSPEESATHILLPEDGERDKAPPRPPPPRKPSASSPPSLPPPRPTHGGQPKTAPLPAVALASPPVASGHVPLGFGAPTPVNRPPPIQVEDWPTGVPRNRVPAVPIVMGAMVTLIVGAALAIFMLPWGDGSTSEVADEPEPHAEKAAPSDDDEATPPAPRPVAAPVVADAQDTSADEPSPPPERDTPTTSPAPAPPPPPPPSPTPEAPRPQTPAPAVPRPAPTPRPQPVPPPPEPAPAPKPTGRKVETTL